MGRPARDISGQRFGRLIAKEMLGRLHGGNVYWRCECECGNKNLSVRGSHLVSGNVQSCGCLQKENGAKIGKLSLVHGHTGYGYQSPTYKSWRNMIKRCEDPKHPSYKHYGGRGISYAERWRVFENFLGDMGERPPGMTLDRTRANGHYEPGNCEWRTNHDQQRNKRNNVVLEFQGRSQVMTDWADELGISKKALWHRLNTLAWSVEKALSTPPSGRRNGSS